MARKTKNRVRIPDVEIDGNDYGNIDGELGETVFVMLLANDTVEIVVGDEVARFSRPKAVQLAELLRRIAEGEPLED